MNRVLIMVLVVVVAVLCAAGCQEEETAGPGAIDNPLRLEDDKPIAAATDASVGPVGWWKFDETEGTTAADSSGNSRDGTFVGDMDFGAASVEGARGKALVLKENQYVQITGYKGVLGTQARTVSAWIKTEHTSGKLLSWGANEGGKQFNFTHHRRRIGITPKGGYFYMNDMLNDDSWHHVAAVILDAELPNLHDDVRLYKDGELAEIHDIGLLDLHPINTSAGEDVTIGKGYQGAIDDVRIYNRALSEQEIIALSKKSE